MKKPVRIADENIYVDSKHHSEPKEYFKFIGKFIKDNSVIIDVGCANGALLNYLQKNHPRELIGIEPVEKLVNIGKELNREINFIHSSLDDLKVSQLKEKGDYVISTGVIGIFENPKLFVKKLLQLVKPNGEIIIFSPFNEEPIDVILKYKYSDSSTWEKGHNLFSISTMNKIAENFNLSLEILNFTFRGNNNHLVYGTNMFSTTKVLIFKKK